MELRELARAAPPAAERRDRPHGEHGDPRRHGHRLRRALPELAARAARDRPQPPRRLAPARVLHVDRQGAARLPRPTTCATRRSTGSSSLSRGPNTVTRAVRARRTSSTACASAGSRSTTRSSRTGCARSRCRCARRRGEVDGRDQPRRAPDDGLAGRPDGAARPCARADRGRHLRARRLPRRGGRVTSVASTETPPRDRVRLGGLTQLVAFTVSIAAALVVWELCRAPGVISERDLPAMSTTVQRAVVARCRRATSGRVRCRPCAAGRSGSRVATVLAVPIGIFLGSSDFAAARVPRADRVPAPDPVGGADPAALPDARHDAQERGLPRGVRRLLAAADPDDVRRARRRPARARHRRARSALGRFERLYRITLPSAVPYIVDRPPDRVDGRRSSSRSPPSSSWACPGSARRSTSRRRTA